jgi:hypothetical protein
MVLVVVRDLTISGRASGVHCQPMHVLEVSNNSIEIKTGKCPMISHALSKLLW